MFAVLIMHSELSVSLWFVHFDIFKNLVSKLVFDVIWRPAVLVVVASIVLFSCFMLESLLTQSQ